MGGGLTRARGSFGSSNVITRPLVGLPVPDGGVAALGVNSNFERRGLGGHLGSVKRAVLRRLRREGDRRLSFEEML